jgi:hypothetical protein
MSIFDFGKTLIQKALEDEKVKKAIAAGNKAESSLAQASNKVATRTSEIVGNTKIKDVIPQIPASGVATIGPDNQLIQGGPGSEMAQGSPLSMPLAQAIQATQPTIMDKIGQGIRSEGRMGTDKAGKGFGNDLYKFFQSVGYGMLDKPLDREANTWDYLGKTIGQIARLNEGSGLGAGQSITQGQSDVMALNTAKQYDSLTQELNTIPEATLADPAKKMELYRAYLRKYPKLQSFLAEYFGLTRSYEYNYPQGLPQGKYPLGGPAVGVE